MMRLYIKFLVFNLVLNLSLIFFEQNVSQIPYYFISLYSTVLIFFLLGFCIYLTRNLFSLISLFSLFFTFFLYGRVILYSISPTKDMFILYNLKETFIGEHYVSIATIISNISIFVIHLSFFWNYHKDRNVIKIVPTENSSLKITFKLFILFAILAAIKLILELNYVSRVGYVSIYLNGLRGVNYYSPVIKNSLNILIVLYGIILMKVPDKKMFIITSIIIGVTSFLASLKGARILFLLPIIFSFWYYYRFYKKSNPLKQIRNNLIIFILVLMVLLSLKARRDNGNIKSNPFVIIHAIFTETGSTLQVVGAYIALKSEVRGDYPFVLEPILYPYFYFRYHSIMTNGQSAKMVEIRNSLNHRLTYNYAPSRYLHGGGLGSSIVAEAYQYGVFYLIIISLIFGGYIRFLEKRMTKGSVFLLLSPILVQSLIFASRASPFPNTWGILKFLVVFGVFKFTIHVLKELTKVSAVEIIHTQDEVIY